MKFAEFFHTLGSRFIVRGDYNAKHTHWGSRLITPKGRTLLKVANNINTEIVTTRKQTYWPTGPNKILNLLDFFIIKDIFSNYIEVLELTELTSDHIPVLLTLGTSVKHKQRNMLLINKKTDADLFKANLNETLTLTVRLKTPFEIDSAVEQLTNNIVKATKTVTPITPTGGNREITYLMEVRELVKQKQKAWKEWHRTRDPSGKTVWNRTSKLLHDEIKKIKKTKRSNHI